MFSNRNWLNKKMIRIWIRNGQTIRH